MKIHRGICEKQGEFNELCNMKCLLERNQCCARKNPRQITYFFFFFPWSTSNFLWRFLFLRVLNSLQIPLLLALFAYYAIFLVFFFVFHFADSFQHILLFQFLVLARATSGEEKEDKEEKISSFYCFNFNMKREKKKKKGIQVNTVRNEKEKFGEDFEEDFEEV